MYTKHRSRSLCRLLLLTGCLLALPTTSQAVLLSDLFQGATITADDKLFSNWNLLSISQVSGLVDTTKIDVTPLVDDPFNPGVKFTADFDALGTLFGHPGGAFAQLRFSFDVSTTNGQALIKDNSLLINDFIFDSGPNASITISETIHDVTGLPLGDKMVVARPGDSPNSGNPAHFDAANFAPQSLVHVEKFIDIQGPDQNDGARLLMFEQRFSQVPEPASLALLGAVVVGGMLSRPRER